MASKGQIEGVHQHSEGDGPTVFAHACKMGLECIVSIDSPTAICFVSISVRVTRFLGAPEALAGANIGKSDPL